MSEIQTILRVELEKPDTAKAVDALFDQAKSAAPADVYQSLVPMIKLLEYQSLDSITVDEIEFSTQLNDTILYIYLYGFDSDLNQVADGIGRFVFSEFTGIVDIYQFIYSFDYVSNYVQKFDGENFLDIYSEGENVELDKKLSELDSLEERFETAISAHLKSK